MNLGELVLVLAEIGLEIDIDAAILKILDGGGGKRVGNVELWVLSFDVILRLP